MTRPRPIRRWDPFRPLDVVGALLSTATALPPVSTGAAAAYRTLFLTLRRLVVGRTLTVHLDSADVEMTITEFDSRLDVRRLAVGQLDDVHLAATEIRWPGGRFERATALLRNVHLRPGAPPVVVAAPVELCLEIPTAALDELFVVSAPRLAGEIGDDGVARLRWARRPGWGHLEVDAELDGTLLHLRPRAVALGGRRWLLPARTPAYRVRLPELPHGLLVTEVCFEPGMMRVRGMVPEWRTEMSRRRLEQILYQLSTAGIPLNLARR
ncbi:hypothetical protein [Mycolicibacterium palauense]|uniref:hypothetical protein n=1 Tax=Mycolicibacterium palauense TaxID=2034511 RepID=UPI000BFEF8D5|nr:hypothetical protein [Mycolicibacterium palauense]